MATEPKPYVVKQWPGSMRLGLGMGCIYDYNLTTLDIVPGRTKGANPTCPALVPNILMDWVILTVGLT